MFDLDRFISEYVTKRPISMFAKDIENHKEVLSEKIGIWTTTDIIT